MSNKKFFLITGLMFINVILISGPAESSYCSDLFNKCQKECYEIRLDDIQQRECFKGCGEAYAQCHKEHPLSACEDAAKNCENTRRSLQTKINSLEGEINALKNMLNRQSQN